MKKKILYVFAVQNGSLAVLGMQGIAKIGLISINYDTCTGKWQKMTV